jgi:hypothetical protein
MPNNGKGVAGTAADKRKQLPGNVENLRPYFWKPGQSGNPQRKNMRAKNTKYLKGIGYRPGEISDAIAGMCAMTQDELQMFCERPDATVLERTVGRALLVGMNKGTLWNLDTLLNRAHGMPKQEMDVQEAKRIEVVFVQGKTIL